MHPLSSLSDEEEEPISRRSAPSGPSWGTRALADSSPVLSSPSCTNDSESDDSAEITLRLRPRDIWILDLYTDSPERHFRDDMQQFPLKAQLQLHNRNLALTLLTVTLAGENGATKSLSLALAEDWMEPHARALHRTLIVMFQLQSRQFLRWKRASTYLTNWIATIEHGMYNVPFGALFRCLFVCFLCPQPETPHRSVPCFLDSSSHPLLCDRLITSSTPHSSPVEVLFPATLVFIYPLSSDLIRDTKQQSPLKTQLRLINRNLLFSRSIPAPIAASDTGFDVPNQLNRRNWFPVCS